MQIISSSATGHLKRVLGFGWTLLLTAYATANLVTVAAEQAELGHPTNMSAVAVVNPSDNLAAKWGIQVSGLFLSSGGNMVDFRYKVLDPAKAAFLTQANTKPELINQSSGTKLVVPDTPKIGQLRQITKQPVIGKIYFILFANTRHQVKSGDKVTIMAGDFKVENLIVE